MVSFLVRQEVRGTPSSPVGPEQSPGRGSRGATPPMRLLLYLKLQGYFGYENDYTYTCTSSIKVFVLVVTITIQLTYMYGIHGFKKKKHTTTSLFNGDARTTRICRKQLEYLGHRMLFKLENQRSHRRKALITKIK